MPIVFPNPDTQTEFLKERGVRRVKGSRGIGLYGLLLAKSPNPWTELSVVDGRRARDEELGA